MIINKFSPVPAGVYEGVIRDIRVKNLKNDRGKYQLIEFCIFLDINNEMVLITPTVFNSNYSKCSYKILESQLKETFETDDINILDHIGLDIVVEIEMNYRNGIEYPSIVWYMDKSEYNKQIEIDCPYGPEPDDD